MLYYLECLLFFTVLCACKVISLSFSHSFLPVAVVKQFFPLVKNVFTEALPPLLIGLALDIRRSVL